MNKNKGGTGKRGHTAVRGQKGCGFVSSGAASGGGGGAKSNGKQGGFFCCMSLGKKSCCAELKNMV